MVTFGNLSNIGMHLEQEKDKGKRLKDKGQRSKLKQTKRHSFSGLSNDGYKPSLPCQEGYQPGHLRPQYLSQERQERRKIFP
jgi:hypothetical protein